MQTTQKQFRARCRCGAVELAAFGRPIVASVCYCADCQAAARRIAARADAPNAAEPDGGTKYLLFREDRFACVEGAERLQALRLKETSATRRMIASCCGSAMVLAFDDARHWVSAYRARFVSGVPPLAMRICAKFRTSDAPLDARVPNYPGYAPRLIVRLLASRLAMAFAPKLQNNPI
jgi:hypothetical protein